MSDRTTERAIYLRSSLREIYPETGQFGPTTAGSVMTIHGIVVVDYACSDGRLPGATARMTFVYAGQEYDHVIKRKHRKAFTERGLAMLARRFAQDVVDRHE